MSRSALRSYTLLTKSGVAPAPLSGLGEPLLSKDDLRNSATNCDEGEEEGETNDSWWSMGMIFGTIVLGTAGLAASAVAMAAAAGIVAVYIAGGFGVVNSLTIVKNEYDISKGPGYRNGIKSLRGEANKLAEQVDVLASAVSELRSEVDLMQTLEQQLHEIANRQGVNVREIVQLVRENEEILAKQRANLKQTFVSDVAKAFISSDFIGPDLRIDLKALPVLVLRLQIQLNSHGLNLDTDKFSAMVERNNDVETVLKLCGDMLSIKTSKDDVDPSTIDMVTIDQKKYSKGSVTAARGKSSHLIQPKLEHRNTVVRDISRKLSMKGIDILSDSDNSSVESEYEPASVSPARYSAAPVRRRRPAATDESPSRRRRPTDSSQEKKSKTAGKFKAAAKISRFAGGSKRDDDYEHRSPSQTSESAQKTQTKSKFKSAAVMATAARSRNKRSDDDMSYGSGSAMRTRTRASASALKGSMRRGTSMEYDDAASVSSRGSQGGRIKGPKFRASTSTEYDDASDSSKDRKSRGSAFRMSFSRKKSSEENSRLSGSESAARRTRSVDKAMSRGTSMEYDDTSNSSKRSRGQGSKSSMFRRSLSIGEDPIRKVRSVDEAVKRSKIEGRDMTPEKGAFSSSQSRRKAPKLAVAGRAASMPTSSGERRVRRTDTIGSSLSQQRQRSSPQRRVRRESDTTRDEI